MYARTLTVQRDTRCRELDNVPITTRYGTYVRHMSPEYARTLTVHRDVPCRDRPCTHKSRLVSSGWSMSAFPPKADIRQRI